jgi:hypothetical protein
MAETEFKRRMDLRLARWYQNADPHPDPELQARRRYVANLVNKSAMLKYAERMTLPIPERYAEVATVEELDFAALPERVVIKPNNSADNDCVMLFDNGREIFSGSEAPVESRAEFVRETFANGRFIKRDTRILAEEFVRDYNESFAVPRDFKVYVAGGRSWVVQVVNRVGPKKSWTHRFYSRDWVPYGPFQMSNLFGEEIPPPPHLDRMIEIADRIARDIDVFMRLDFYISAKGPVFGEFTSYPNAGMRFTEIGNAVLCDLMDRYPDPF